MMMELDMEPEATMVAITSHVIIGGTIRKALLEKARDLRTE